MKSSFELSVEMESVVQLRGLFTSAVQYLSEYFALNAIFPPEPSMA